MKYKSLLVISMICGFISMLCFVIAETLPYNPFFGFWFSEPIFLYDVYGILGIFLLAPTLFCGSLWFGINYLLEE